MHTLEQRADTHDHRIFGIYRCRWEIRRRRRYSKWAQWRMRWCRPVRRIVARRKFTSIHKSQETLSKASTMFMLMGAIQQLRLCRWNKEREREKLAHRNDERARWSQNVCLFNYKRPKIISAVPRLSIHFSSPAAFFAWDQLIKRSWWIHLSWWAAHRITVLRTFKKKFAEYHGSGWCH